MKIFCLNTNKYNKSNNKMTIQKVQIKINNNKMVMMKLFKKKVQ